MRGAALVLWILPALLLVVGCGGDDATTDAGGGNGKPSTTPEGTPEETPGPAIEPKVEAANLEGLMDAVEEGHDKYVVVNLWADWCGDCVAELPAIVGMRKALAGKADVIGVSVDFVENRKSHPAVDTAVEVVRARAKAARLAYPIYVAEGVEFNDLCQYFEVPLEVPHTILFTKDGEKVAHHGAFESAEQAVAWFEEAIAK